MNAHAFGVGFCADLNVKGSRRSQKLKEANESSRFFMGIVVYIKKM
jgi:hypothetical protein